MEEPVEILVGLAKSGEIDPWNIDIVDVTDRFLKKLEDRGQLDLWVSGRTLLYASILLRMKSEALIEGEVEEEEFFDFQPDYSQAEEYPVLHLNVRRQSKRPVTLLELIDELKNAIDRREQSRVRGIRREQNRPTTEDALRVVNQENLENQIQMVMEKLKKKFKKQKRISFSELVEEKNPSSIVQTYIPLLFLAIRKKIRLEQKELFGDIYIKSRFKSA
ncbi:MAG: segregation/condensation protein A [Methanocellales archaeon]|nr:segregation/condensation protein A [Methanocellales archaeon]